MSMMRSPPGGGDAGGRLLPQAVPGTIRDLLPLPERADDGFSLADEIVAERDRDAAAPG